MSLLRIVSWNSAGRTMKAAQQVAALAERDADVIAVQEVRPAALPCLIGLLARSGYDYTFAAIVESRR